MDRDAMDQGAFLQAAAAGKMLAHPLVPQLLDSSPSKFLLMADAN